MVRSHHAVPRRGARICDCEIAETKCMGYGLLCYEPLPRWRYKEPITMNRTVGTVALVSAGIGLAGVGFTQIYAPHARAAPRRGV